MRIAAGVLLILAAIYNGCGGFVKYGCWGGGLNLMTEPLEVSSVEILERADQLERDHADAKAGGEDATASPSDPLILSDDPKERLQADAKLLRRMIKPMAPMQDNGESFESSLKFRRMLEDRDLTDEEIEALIVEAREYAVAANDWVKEAKEPARMSVLVGFGFLLLFGLQIGAAFVLFRQRAPRFVMVVSVLSVLMEAWCIVTTIAMEKITLSLTNINAPTGLEITANDLDVDIVMFGSFFILGVSILSFWAAWVYRRAKIRDGMAPPPPSSAPPPPPPSPA